jgi:hypothetical protein
MEEKGKEESDKKLSQKPNQPTNQKTKKYIACDGDMFL